MNKPEKFPCPHSFASIPLPQIPLPNSAVLTNRSVPPRPQRVCRAIAVCISICSSPLCVLSDLCGVPLRALTSGAFPENTAEIGRNAEGKRGGGAHRVLGKEAVRVLHPPLPPHALRVGCGPAALCSSCLCGPNDSVRLQGCGYTAAGPAAGGSGSGTGTTASAPAVTAAAA